MKVSLYFQDETWNKFKRRVLQKTGESRNLSSQVQELLEDSVIEDSVRLGFEQMKVDTTPISSSHITAIKPSVSTSSSATLKKMRERRFGSKALPRQ